MKSYSKLYSAASDSFESLPAIRGRVNVQKISGSKFRNYSNGALNVSGSSNTTECSLLKNQESFSVLGKPPRVPMLKTAKMKVKEKSELSFVETDEKYYWAEYKKHEIIKSRQISLAQSPFWYMDMLNTDEEFDRKIKESNRASSFTLEELIACRERSGYNNWLCGMQAKT